MFLSVGDTIQPRPDYQNLMLEWVNNFHSNLRLEYGSIVDIDCLETHLWNEVIKPSEEDEIEHYDDYFNTTSLDAIYHDYHEELGGIPLPGKALDFLARYKRQHSRILNDGLIISTHDLRRTGYRVEPFHIRTPICPPDRIVVTETMVMKADDIGYLAENRDPVGSWDDDIELSPFFLFGRSQLWRAKTCLTPFCEVPNSDGLHYVIKIDCDEDSWFTPNVFKKV